MDLDFGALWWTFGFVLLMILCVSAVGFVLDPVGQDLLHALYAAAR